MNVKELVEKLQAHENQAANIEYFIVETDGSLVAVHIEKMRKSILRLLKL